MCACETMYGAMHYCWRISELYVVYIRWKCMMTRLCWVNFIPNIWIDYYTTINYFQMFMQANRIQCSTVRWWQRNPLCAVNYLLYIWACPLSSRMTLRIFNIYENYCVCIYLNLCSFYYLNFIYFMKLYVA